MSPSIDDFPDNQYQVGGSLSTSASSYVERQADRELLDALLAGEFCYVLNSRQMGKSSLQVRTAEQLRQQGICCAILDLTSIGNEQITAEQWYASLLHSLSTRLNLDSFRKEFRTWWNGVSQFSLIQRLAIFFEQILLQEIESSVVIFIDEIDSVLGLDFPCDDFFALIRHCYNQRANDPKWKRLTFAILGVASPSELITTEYQTPFNIGRAITLKGFKEQEVYPLVSGLSALLPHPEKALTEILHWTQGQPFLTQKICQIIVDIETGQCLGEQEKSSTVQLQYKDFKPEDYSSYIANVVHHYVIEDWLEHDEPEHFRSIRDRILHNSKNVNLLLNLYQKILEGNGIKADDSSGQAELKLSGLVTVVQSNLQVKNPIYKAIFHSDWAIHHLNSRRPYAHSLNAWVAAGCADASKLLTGEALKQALFWAKDRQLGEIDQHFVNASQAQEKLKLEDQLTQEKEQRQQVQASMKTAKQAQQLLSWARQQAREKMARQSPGKRYLLGCGSLVAFMVSLLQYSGALQKAEWWLMDEFVQWRSSARLITPTKESLAQSSQRAPNLVNNNQSPPAPFTPPITVITIDEADAETLGQVLVNDAVLLQVLAKIQAQSPRLIGLDLYRNLPIEPGHDQLMQFLAKTPNVIGINRVVESPLSAAAPLADAGRFGFADQIIDTDGTVRRALLAIEDEAGNIQYNFALRLAAEYLKADGIIPQRLQNHHIQLGQLRLSPFQGYEGGYVRADAGGYQVLLNYRGPHDQIQTFSLSDVLGGYLPPNILQDQIVLIGSIDSTQSNRLKTPYEQSLLAVPEYSSGVMLHAEILEQLLQGALKGRPLMQTWPESLEYAWIGLWSVLGILIGSSHRFPRKMLLLLLLAEGGLVAIAYLCFVANWWIPLLPCILGLNLAPLIHPLSFGRHYERKLIQEIVQFLQCSEDFSPDIIQLALYYLQQSEKPAHHLLIKGYEKKISHF